MASISVPDLICNSMKIDWSEPFSTKGCHLFLLRICLLCWNGYQEFSDSKQIPHQQQQKHQMLSLLPALLITFTLRCWSWINVTCYLLFVFWNWVRSPLNLPLQVTKLWVETNLHKYVTCSIILSCVHEMKRVSLCFLMIGLINNNMCLVQTIVEK